MLKLTFLGQEVQSMFRYCWERFSKKAMDDTEGVMQGVLKEEENIKILAQMVVQALTGHSIWSTGGRRPKVFGDHCCFLSKKHG